MEGNRKLIEENRQVVVENRQSLEGRLDGLGQNHQQVTLQLKSLDERYESYNSRVDRRLSMGELPPRGGNPSPTFNIPVDQPPMHGAGQPPPIPMAKPYVAPANMGKVWTLWGSCRQGDSRGAWT
ncbi:hypothetical protein LINGRAHAP2_LOCUS24950 [Linum grandiflorum]